MRSLRIPVTTAALVCAGFLGFNGLGIDTRASSSDTVLYGPATYVRQSGPPVTVTNSFRVQSPLRAATLQLWNYGVASAVISVDGQVVLGPNDFSASQPSGTLIERPLSLPVGTNSISVELRSEPGTFVQLDVVGAYAPIVSDLQPAQLTLAADGGTGLLTVTVQQPDSVSPMDVELSSGDSTVAAVPSDVMVAAGTTTATFVVTAGNSGGPIAITARLNGTSATSQVTVRVRPAPPVVTQPLAEGAMIVAGKGVANASVDLFVDGTITGYGSVGSDGMFSISVPALHAGQSVTATQSLSGVTSLPSSPVIVQARPPAPTITAPLIDGSTQVTGSASAAATVTVLVNSASAATALAAGDGTFTIALDAPLIAGQQVSATQTVGGVTSIPSAVVTVVAIPAPPAVSGPIVAGSSTIGGTGSNGATVEAFVDNASVGVGLVGAGGAWTIAVSNPLIVGQHVKARQTVAGVSSAFSPDVIVAARPAPPTITGPLVDGSMSVAGTGLAGATIGVFVNGSSAASASVGSDGAWIAELGSPLIVGQSVTAAQTAGGIQSDFTPPLVVEARPPAPVISGPLVDGATTVSGSGTAAAALQLYVNSAFTATTTVGSSGTWSLTLQTPLIAGQQVMGRQVLAGVVGDFSAPLTVLVRPPAPEINSPIFAGATTIAGSGSAGASLEAFVDGVSLGTTAVPNNGMWALPLTSTLSAGQTITAQQTVNAITSPLSAPVVVQVGLVRIDITPSPTATLTQGQVIQFTARGTFSDGSVQDPLTSVTWVSDAPSIATIDPTGVLTSVAAGIADITASQGAVDSIVTAVTVKPLAPTVASPLIAGATTVSGTGAEPGALVQVYVNAVSRGGSIAADASGQWTVAAFSPALVANDSVTATEAVNGVISDLSAPVVVGASVLTQIIISPSPTATVTKGQTIAFSARGIFSDGTAQDPLPGVLWSSDNAAATITGAGVASGVSAGSANILASFSGVQSSATTLRIKPLPPAVTSPLAAGATVVAGTDADSGASIQLFVNGVIRGLPALAGTTGLWSSSNLAPLSANDSVSARQFVNGIASDPSPAVLVRPGVPRITSSPSLSWNWLRLAPLGGPPSGRTGAINGQTYDPTNDRLMTFSGGGALGQPVADDIWILDEPTQTWLQLFPRGPAARSGHAAAYAAGSNRLIVQGGVDSTNTILTDTWALSNANGMGGAAEWSRLPDSPVALANRPGAYDPSTNSLILFGGADALGNVSNGTWLLTGADGTASSAWTELVPIGGAPPARELHAAAYDSASNRLIVFGGQSGSAVLNDTWVLTHANGAGGAPEWIQLTPSNPPPPARFGHSVAYSAATNQLFLFGGRASTGGAAFSDIWVLSNANGSGGTPAWTPVSPTGAGPLARSFAALGLSPSADRLVVALGDGFTSDLTQHPNAQDVFLSDAWQLSHTTAGQVGQMFSYALQASDPDPSTKLTFSLDMGPRGMGVDPASGLLEWTPGADQTGEFNVVVRVTDTAGLVATQTFTITVNVENQAPVANAGSNQTISAASTTLTGSISDDGFPVPGAVTAHWTAQSGPGAVTFADPNAASTTASFSAPGAYVLCLTADDLQQTASNCTTVIFDSAPVVDAGPDQTIALPSVAALHGTASDPDLPIGGVLTTSWTLVSGPGTVTFSDPRSLITTASFSAAGTYVLRLAANDSLLTSHSDLTINVEECLTEKEPGVRIPSVSGAEMVPLGDGRLRAYVVQYSSNFNQVMSFVSTDGINWTEEPGTRLTGVGLADVHVGRIVPQSDSSLRMYFWGTTAHDGPGSVYSAVSPDGLTWTQDSGIRIDSDGGFGCQGVQNPEVVSTPSGSLRMYYRCVTDEGGITGFIVSATSADGLTWTVEPGVRIAAGINNTGLDLGPFGPRVLTLPDGTYRMLYSGTIVPTSGFSDIDRIFSATSTDGLAWTSEPGIRVDHGAAGSSDSRVAAFGQFVPLSDGTFRLYYVGYGDLSETGLLSARWCSVGPNNPPAVTAGPDQTITLPANTVSLSGIASDDGLPASSVLTFAWRVLSGPGPVVFSDPTSLSTTAQFTVPGGYRLRLTASDGQLTSASELAVTVLSATAPGLLSVTPNSAGPGQALTVTVTAQNTVFVQGSTSVDFGAGITVGAVTVSSPTSLTAQLSIAVDAATGQRDVTVTTGTQTLVLPSGFTVQSEIPRPPVVNAGPNLTIAQGFSALVSNYAGAGGGVLRFDGPTGAFLDAFVPPYAGTNIPVSSVIGPDGNLYVLDNLRQSPSDSVGISGVVRFDGRTGAFIDQFIPYGSGGLTDPDAFAFGADGLVYIWDPRIGQLNRYDGHTGAFVDVFYSTPPVPGKPAMAFGPDGNIYIQSDEGILRIDASTGANLGAFVPNPPSFAGGGEFVFHGSFVYVMYATSSTSFRVSRYDAASGSFVDDFIPSAGTLPPGGIAFAPDGTLWAWEGDSSVAGDVLRFDGTTGAFLNVILPQHTGGVWDPMSPTFVASARTTLNGSVTDAGSPGGAVSLQWTQVSGPGLATFASSTAPQTAVEFSAPGVYLLRLAGMAGGLSSSSDVTVTVQASSTGPTLDSIVPGSAAQGTTLTVTIGGLNTHFASGTTTFQTLDAPEVGTFPFGMNDAGQVVGSAIDASGMAHGFVLSGGVYSIVDHPGAATGEFGGTEVLGISNNGTMVGDFYSCNVPNGYGCRYSYILIGGTFIDLPDAPGSKPGTTAAWSINDAGQIVGYYMDSCACKDHGFIYSDGIYTVLDQPGFATTAIQGGINDAGQIVGSSSVTWGSGIDTGFLYQAGTFSSIPGLPTGADAVGINSTGDIAARYFDGTRSHTFVISGGVATEIVPPAAVQGAAVLGQAINSARQVVGEFKDSSNVSHGFLATPVAGSQISFGPDIDVNSVALSSPTSLTAQITVGLGAQVGPRSLTVTSGTEVVSAPDGFDVLSASQPSLTTVAPSSVRPGQTNVSVEIQGQNTHFVQGVTQIDLGAGIMVNSLVVNSLTDIVANLDVAASVPLGNHGIVVSTGTEIVSLAGGLSVIEPLPSITAVAPASGQQGQGGPVTIAGVSTHFVQGVTAVSLGPGITVSGVAVSCQTCLSMQVLIDPAATTGPRPVTVTTGSETVTGTFTVLAGTPLLTSLNPASGLQGQTLAISLTGVFTHFAEGITGVSLGAGVNVSSIVVASPTALSAQIAIDPTAATGPRTVTVTTGGEIVSVPNVFNVGAPAPALISLSPAVGQDGQTVLAGIVGQNTHFVQGSTSVTLGVDIAVSNIIVVDATHIHAQLAVPVNAALGTRTLTVTTGSEIVTWPAAFAVTGALSRIDIRPAPSASVVEGQTLQFFARGTFADGSVLDPLPGVTWTGTNGAIAAVSPIGLATGLLGGTAGIGASRAGITSAPTVFTVQPLPPSILAPITSGASLVSGAGADPGASVQIFVNGVPRGSPAIADGSGNWSALTLPPALVANDTVFAQQTANGVQGAPSAAVVVGVTPPSLISSSPSGAQLGTASLVLTVTGRNTHFAQGLTSLSVGGAGVTVVAVTVTSATTLTATVSVALTASTGARDVVVATGAEIVSLSGAFAIQPSTNQAPTITIASSWSDALPSRLTLTYAVNDDGLPLGGALTTTWTVISGPGAAGFQNQTPTAIDVAFSQAGTYVLGITASDTQLTATQNVTVTVTGSLPSPPVVAIASPSDGTQITTPVSVIGTVTSAALASWSLQFRLQGDATFRTLATGTASVTNAALGTLDPTLLLNGIGFLQLTATDTAGQTTTAGPVSLVIAQNQKVGNFTVSFTDLSVPVAGLPIQIVRTYDSRNKAVGDFGIGWRLDLNTVTLATNGALGDGWTGTGGGTFPNYCVEPTRSHLVTVTFADGTVFEFQPTLAPACQELVPLEQSTLAFTPVSTTPPNATLTPLGTNQPFLSGAYPGPITLLDLDDTTTLDPDLYLLTMPDGRKLVISRLRGLQTLSDPNGNTLTVSASGIVHSSGTSVVFQRDAENRITQVTDPAGHTLLYGYNGDGNLQTVRDQNNNVTTFAYDAAHDLVLIQDPRGVQPIKNVYDDSGRLIQHVDAFGHTISYTHDVADRQEIVTDRLGNVTVNEYDLNGNIVKVTDAAGGVTTRTYDSRNNLLSETNPLGKTRTYTYDPNDNRLSDTDPLGNTTAYTYNSRNQVLTVTDPLGHVTTNTYDASGNLVSTKDPLGNLTSYAYNASGLRTSMTDALGDMTSYQYDAAGNLTQQTDALGHATTYTYDADGNRLSESRTQTTATGSRTVTTQYQYDGQNHLTQTTFADGGTTQTAYNTIGKAATTTDQLGRHTAYTYDLMGRLTTTTFPDDTTETSGYDAEGDRTASTDRGGRTTTYTYDPLKRLTQTTFSDGTSTSTAYDAAGEVTRAIDPRGNVTQYTYDSAGRRTATTDAAGHPTTFTYDAVGNQVAMQDANGNKTGYQYDANNRRLRTLYADGTSDSAAYDALGRTTGKTDQAGLTTQFQYDALGRLISVIDALNQTTSYSYDELGNRLSQTDANHHSTLFGYDALGRRTARTLPVGMTETSTYDAAGNVVSHADFNGRTTTYAYDLLNRLTRKTPDPVFGEPAVQYSYGPTGQRSQMVDPSGTTTYTYDARDRLLSKATPEGTLTYTYDAAGDLTSIQSSNTGGTSVSYAYDVLNRLAIVTDNRLTPGVTAYSYDNVGNLAGFTAPNRVTHSYSYDTLNRLTALTVADGSATSLASYAYTLGPAGNRTAVTELGGRQAAYRYDNLYRLTVETITGAVGGTTTYAYDPVGNRLAKTSPSVGLILSTYDANDRLMTDFYDNNGNTVGSAGNMFSYDFENHLTGENSGAVSVVYDGDGNRVAETVGGVTTTYLVDDRNPTGYPQVLEELSGGAVQRVYTYGLNRISESQSGGTSFYGYDGHGSVRLLTDATGGVTDRYDYDAFGNLISQAGSTPNVYQYSGEQNDPNLGFYYLRARYLNVSSGRFSTADPMSAGEGPLSNWYAYASDQPTDLADPSGLWPTETHNYIIEHALLLAPPVLSLEDISVLEASSESQDDVVSFGQNASNSYQHHMRAWYQSESAARSKYEIFLATNLAQANFAESSGFHTLALTLLGKNLHAISDGTSPAHSCLATTTVKECSGVFEGFRPWGGVFGGVVAPFLVARHIAEESSNSDPGINEAITLVHNYYIANFGISLTRRLTSHAGVSISAESDVSVSDLASTLGVVAGLGGGIF